MQYTFYTNATATIPAHSGAVLAYKSPTTSAVVVSASAGAFTFPTGATAGAFVYQISTSGGQVVEEGTFDIRQDLAHAPEGYDPRSLAVRTLEALDAKIAGRALTIQQSKISVDGRSIEYMNSIDELLKWRDHFQILVNKEQGRGVPTAEVCWMRRS